MTQGGPADFKAFLERAVKDGWELNCFMAEKGWDDVQRGLAAIETCRTAIEKTIERAEAKN